MIYLILVTLLFSVLCEVGFVKVGKEGSGASCFGWVLGDLVEGEILEGSQDTAPELQDPGAEE